MKYGLKKILAFLLTAAMCLGLIPMAALAENGMDDSGTLETQTVLNPLYEGIVSEDDLTDPASVPVTLAADDVEEGTIEAAGESVREAMKERETTVSVLVNSDSSGYSQLMRDVVTEAIKHTGVPTEGDYLAWQYAGYSVSGTYRRSTDGYNYTFTYTFTYYTTAEQEDEVTAKVDTVLDELISDDMTDYEKVCAIYHYICCNVEYDYAHHDDSSYKLQFTAYAALIQNIAVCQGYATLFYRLALECGIDARVITGTEYGSGEAHAWNIVCLDGKYYNLDATWDTTIYNSSMGVYEYFLETTASFNEHVRSSEYSSDEFNAAFPMATSDYSEAYIYHVMQFSYTTANCEESGVDVFTCAVCGAMEERPAVAVGQHSWDSGTVIKAPTCTEDGEMLYTCELCGATTTETIEALGHDWDSGTVTTEPTCTEDGVLTYTCTRCGATETESISALGHIWDDGVVTTEPACTKEGVRTYTCLRCGDTMTEAIAALGHEWGEVDEITAPTCTKEGYELDYCERCGEYQYAITPALGHEWGELDEITAPTCTKDGYELDYCERCGEYQYAVTPALGHDYVSAVTTEPTCGAEGVLTWTCTRCGDFYTEPIAATGDHTWDDGTVVVAATCGEEGLIEIACTVCGASYMEITPATGEHDWDDGTVIEPASCGTGITRYTCKVCGLEEDEVTPALEGAEHDWDDGEIVREPTCGAYGETRYICKVCGHHILQPIDPTGDHTWDDGTVTKEPTCTEDGIITFTCTVCGDTYTEVIPSVGGHEWGKVTFEWADDYSSATASRTCERCGDTETVDATVTPDITEPTCTMDGKAVYTATAEFDGVTYEDEKDEILPAPGHDWGKVTFEWSDDYSSAEASHTCQVCGVTESAPAEVTKETFSPTCTEAGKIVYTAKAVLDGMEYEDEKTVETEPATGHTWGEVQWTWNEDYTSATATRTCTVCGASESVTTGYITSVTTEPTDNENGKIVYTATAVFSDDTIVTGTATVILYSDTINGFAEKDGNWYYFVDSEIDYGLNTVMEGTVAGQNGWWYVVGGEVQLNFTGLAEYGNDHGWWYIENGKVNFDHNCVDHNSNGWWYVVGSKVQFGFTGLAEYGNEYGWWYIENGKVNFDHNCVDMNSYGWWYVVGSQVQFGFTGLANYGNEYGWWYIESGKVNFDFNGVEQNNYGWWYVVGSEVQFGYTGVANYANAYGWWYIKDGKVDFSCNSVEQNAYGWWYVTGGKVDFSYTGLASNGYGTWFLKDGKVDFGFNGTCCGRTIRNGKAV